MSRPRALFLLVPIVPDFYEIPATVVAFAEDFKTQLTGDIRYSIDQKSNQSYKVFFVETLLRKITPAGVANDGIRFIGLLMKAANHVSVELRDKIADFFELAEYKANVGPTRVQIITVGGGRGIAIYGGRSTFHVVFLSNSIARLLYLA